MSAMRPSGRGPDTSRGSITTGTCEYVLRSKRAFYDDECSFGLGDGNNRLEPGERISDVRIEVVNYGTITVTNCRAAPTPTPSEACTHAGAVTDPAPLLFYQVKGFCSGEEGP